ncbi:MAG: alpha/beta fold hydrolase [Phycisphaeraceae bacterium]
MKHHPIIAIVFVLLLRSAAFAEQSVPPVYGDHSNLLVYRDAGGREHAVKSKEDWAKRRGHVLLGMQQAMGALPERDKLPKLEVREGEVHKREEYTRITITFVAEVVDGKEDRVPAYLYLPAKRGDGEQPKQRPAMLVLHQTHALGKGDCDWEKGRTNRCLASELAARGYVVLAPDYPSFGDYTFDFAAMYKAGRYASGSMKGIFNHMRAVDLLQSREDVDGERIGVIGHSLGGHNAMFLAAFDERVKVIVSSCGWTPFHDYYGGKIAGWTSDRYMPRLREVYQLDAGKVPFDFYEVVAALAPRPFYSCSPTRDSNFDVMGVKKAGAKAKQVYELFKAEEKLVIEHPDSAHDFPPASREAAYKFIDEALSTMKSQR